MCKILLLEGGHVDPKARFPPARLLHAGGRWDDQWQRAVRNDRRMRPSDWTAKSKQINASALGGLDLPHK